MQLNKNIVKNKLVRVIRFPFPILTVLLDLKCIPLIIKNSSLSQKILPKDGVLLNGDEISYCVDIRLVKTHFYCLYLESVSNFNCLFPVFQTAQWLTSLHPSRHLCPQSEFLLKKKKNVEKLEKVLRRKKNLLEFPQESPPRDSGVSSVNHSVDAGRSCLLYSTKSRTQAHSGYQAHFRPWVTASLPRGAHPPHSHHHASFHSAQPSDQPVSTLCFFPKISGCFLRACSQECNQWVKR